MNTAPQKPVAPAGVEQSLLDATVEATERQMSDRAILHVYGNIEAYKAMAASIARSGLTHHKTEAHVITIALAAYEMNIPVTVALRGMYLVQGKLAMETWLMDLIATRNGVSKTVHEATRTRCRMTLHHKDRPDLDVEYSIEDAKRAGIVSAYNKDGTDVKASNPSWRKYTEEMVYWRCLSKGLRRIAPDLFGGVYTTDESSQFDPRRQGSGAVTDTNKALGIATEPVEPDPNEFSEDEIDAMAKDFARGVKLDLCTPMDEQIASNLVIDGQWEEAREMWDALRGQMARHEAEAA